MPEPTIKIGNQEVELEAAKRLLRDAHLAAHESPAEEALSAAIKEAEKVEGPFGRNGDGDLTFRGEVVKDEDGHTIDLAAIDIAALNRILSQHFVSKDELRKVLAADNPKPPTTTLFLQLRATIRALIEKGAPDA